MQFSQVKRCIVKREEEVLKWAEERDWARQGSAKKEIERLARPKPMDRLPRTRGDRPAFAARTLSGINIDLDVTLPRSIPCVLNFLCCRR